MVAIPDVASRASAHVPARVRDTDRRDVPLDLEDVAQLGRACACGPLELVADHVAVGPGTAVATRVAAGAALLGSVAAGALLARSRRGTALACLLAATTAGSVAALAAAGARRSRAMPAAPPSPRDAGAHTGAAPFVTVLIPARNEAEHLPRLLDDLRRQDHRGVTGEARFEVLVIDDRSADQTPDLVRGAAASGEETSADFPIRLVTRRGSGLADGKGAALRSVPDSAIRGDLLLVLDADSRVPPNLVRRIAEALAAGAGALPEAVTARRRMLATRRSSLAGAQDDEQTTDLLLQLGRGSFGGAPELRGNGIALTRDALARAGGWPVAALTEDLELSTRLALAGIVVEPLVDVVVAEAPVAGLRALWTQRVRWAEGSVRRYLELGPAIVTSPRLGLRRRLDLVAYGLQLLVPGVIAGAIVGGLSARRAATPAVLLATYTTGAVASSAVALAVLEPPQPPRPRLARRRLVRRALRTAVFGGHWLLVLPIAFLRIALDDGELRYRKTCHRHSDC